MCTLKQYFIIKDDCSFSKGESIVFTNFYIKMDMLWFKFNLWFEIF